MNHAIRHKDGGLMHLESYSPRQAIRAFCFECMGWQDDPRDCTSTMCPLYPFRGKIIHLTDEQRAQRSEEAKARGSVEALKKHREEVFKATWDRAV